jgi:hypothetical protein
MGRFLRHAPILNFFEELYKPAVFGSLLSVTLGENPLTWPEIQSRKRWRQLPGSEFNGESSVSRAIV